MTLGDARALVWGAPVACEDGPMMSDDESAFDPRDDLVCLRHLSFFASQLTAAVANRPDGGVTLYFRGTKACADAPAECLPLIWKTLQHVGDTADFVYVSGAGIFPLPIPYVSYDPMTDTTSVGRPEFSVSGDRRLHILEAAKSAMRAWRGR